MEYRSFGKIIKGVGGLYTVRIEKDGSPLAGELAKAKARGSFRHDGITPLVGDNVSVVYTDKSLSEGVGGDIMISEIGERKNSLIHPPVANIDICLVSMAAVSPEPVPESIRLPRDLPCIHRCGVCLPCRGDLHRDRQPVIVVASVISSLRCRFSSPIRFTQAVSPR